MILKKWESNRKSTLSLILMRIYEFFIFLDPSDGYNNEATHLLRENKFSLFKQKCLEYTKLYASDEFDDKLEYLFQDYIYTKKEFEDSSYFFYDIISKKSIVKKIDKYELIGKVENFLCNYFCLYSPLLIIGNNRIFKESSKRFNEEFGSSDNHIIIVAPGV